MTANELYFIGYIFGGIVALCSIGFFVDNIKPSNKKFVGLAAIFFLVLGAYFNYQGKDIEVRAAIQDGNDIKAKYDSVRSVLVEQSELIKKASNNLSNIEKALSDNHLFWDSTNKMITPITINQSQNVTSHNQKSGQTAFKINNYNK